MRNGVVSRRWGGRAARIPWLGSPLFESAFWTAFWNSLWKTLLAIVKNLRKVTFDKKEQELRLQDTLALGEKRFLAVVQWEGERLLVGVTAQSITLLKPKEFAGNRETQPAG